MLGFKEFFFNNHDYDCVNLYQNHAKIREISSLTGKSIGEVYRSLARFGIQPNRKQSLGEHVHFLKNSGMTTAQIATMTGYSDRNVRYILRKNNDSR